ncbi:MAG: hypothetical protein J6S53_01220 [Lentisphaeria bacterium]|nr:hypothetical protein [Lentisphaeria bacterium]
MELYKFDLNLNYLVAATFIPVLINFAILVFNPYKAQKIGKALIFQLAGLVALPVVSGGIMKIAGAEPKMISLVIFVLECILALVMIGFSIPQMKAFKENKAVWTSWLLGAFSLVFWGYSLLHMVMQHSA